MKLLHKTSLTSFPESEVVNELIEGLNKTSSLQSSWLNYAKPTTAILTAITRLYDRHALQQ